MVYIDRQRYGWMKRITQQTKEQDKKRTLKSAPLLSTITRSENGKWEEMNENKQCLTLMTIMTLRLICTDTMLLFHAMQTISRTTKKDNNDRRMWRNKKK